ncbi:hypothetical protein BT96DRAFT_166429 [Gymnopus androsaceus JB14]|uniref:Uncharacterized protein n=1 Tax=Gymnopus androsaceus JB14 TaxID=1447944 RepID=A0A6A4HA40_9AGAR|nr:hypothetical protein BT96DRAFT_166429 [Gymnopus androsaceus JB14]
MATFCEDGLPQTVSVMLLVDNNRFTQNAWSDLCDQCLPSLFERLGSAYPSALFRTLVQESCFTDQNIAEVPPASREYHTLKDAVQDVRFSATSTCKLTVPLIHGTIQFLSSSAAMARHIIIIGSSALHNEYSTSNWYHLARSLAVGKIYCHLLLHAHAAGPAEPLNLVFNETLRLQNLVEDKPWFSNDRSRIIPRLSIVRSSVPQVGTPLEAAPALPHPGPSSLPLLLDHMQAPQPMQPPASSSASASSQEEEPSLVTQLQQMHGLTKKKVYGSKPKRRPFVSAEIYREHPRKASSLSPVSPSDTNHGGRVTSPSLIDRSARVYHQNGPVPVLPHPRSLVDIRSSSSMSERDPVSPYPTTRMPVSSPSSPVLNHPPSYWNTSTSVSSRTTRQQQQHQQHPISLTSSRSQPSPYTTATTISSTYSTKSNPETGLTEGPLISHG